MTQINIILYFVANHSKIYKSFRSFINYLCWRRDTTAMSRTLALRTPRSGPSRTHYPTTSTLHLSISSFPLYTKYLFSSCSPQAPIDLVKCQMLIHFILIIDIEQVWKYPPSAVCGHSWLSSFIKQSVSLRLSCSQTEVKRLYGREPGRDLFIIIDRNSAADCCQFQN